MSILIIKSGTTSIAGATVKGDFTYFSATTKGLGATIDTGFWSGVDPTCDGYTVYKIGGQNGWATMVATGREQLNYYLKLFGGTGTTVDENVTWATNSNNIFLHSGSTGPCPTPTPTATGGLVTPTPTSPPSTPTPTSTPVCPFPIYTHGALLNTCSDYCNINYLIQTVDCASANYFSLSIGDFIYGYAGQTGYLAYSSVSTDTNTGPFRIADIDGTGEILGLYVCSGGSCIPL